MNIVNSVNIMYVKDVFFVRVYRNDYKIILDVRCILFYVEFLQKSENVITLYC